MERITYHVLGIKKNAHERGFTVLFAALVASLVLTLGISVFTIAQKQLILSSIGRNSQYAFYAADTGAECALYWDIRHGAFTTGSILPDIACDVHPDIVITPIDFGGGRVDYEAAQFDSNGYCVEITVTKQLVHPRTRIHSNGYSVPCSDIETSSRVLQRSVELTY